MRFGSGWGCCSQAASTVLRTPRTAALKPRTPDTANPGSGKRCPFTPALTAGTSDRARRDTAVPPGATARCPGREGALSRAALAERRRGEPLPRPGAPTASPPAAGRETGGGRANAALPLHRLAPRREGSGSRGPARWAPKVRAGRSAWPGARRAVPAAPRRQRTGNCPAGPSSSSARCRRQLIKN